jgi:hypothetical protein
MELLRNPGPPLPHCAMHHAGYIIAKWLESVLDWHPVID